MKPIKINDYCFTTESGHVFTRGMFAGSGIVTVWLNGECLGTFNSSKTAISFVEGNDERNWAEGIHKGDA